MEVPPAQPAAAAPRATLWANAIALGAALAVACFFGQTTGLRAFQALTLLVAWGALVAFVHALPPLPWRLRPLLALTAGAALAWWPLRWTHLPPPPGASATDDRLRLIAVVFAVLAFALYFFASYNAHTRREQAHPALDALIPLTRLLAAAFAAMVGVLLVHLYGQRNWLNEARAACFFVAGLLAAETLLRWLGRLYTPRRLRRPFVLGQSVLLPAFFGEAGPLQSLSATLQETFGVRLGETWLVQLARRFVAPLALAGLLATWLSSSVTRVPVGHRGVLLVGGALESAPLGPGLHLHAPWPWGRVTILATERVQELAIGFERDLAGPILWAEKHFEGEQNLLVGQGEELLTINVPIHYRVRDAIAFFEHTQDAAAALEALGSRELLTLASSHTAFGLMTTDRAEISASLKARLQAACDRLRLGLEIVFVGLKDVHPPVAVAPSYQDVVSAEEQQATLVDSARTYAVETGANALITALQTRQEAESAATARLLRAQGEASRFLAPLPIFRDQPELLRIRLRLDTLEESLPGLRQLYLVPPGSTPRTTLLPGANAPLLPR